MCVGLLELEYVYSIVELVMCTVGEVGGLHAREAIVGDIPCEFKVVKKKCAGFCFGVK